MGELGWTLVMVVMGFSGFMQWWVGLVVYMLLKVNFNVCSRVIFYF